MNPGPLSKFHAPSPSSILFNGAPAERNMRGLVAFVEQDDEHHYAALTVRETLRYASILRLPASIGLKKKLARAEEVMSMLGLRDCANTLVGGPMLKVTMKVHTDRRRTLMFRISTGHLRWRKETIKLSGANDQR